MTDRISPCGGRAQEVGMASGQEQHNIFMIVRKLDLEN